MGWTVTSTGVSTFHVELRVAVTVALSPMSPHPDLYHNSNCITFLLHNKYPSGLNVSSPSPRLPTAPPLFTGAPSPLPELRCSGAEPRPPQPAVPAAPFAPPGLSPKRTALETRLGAGSRGAGGPTAGPPSSSCRPPRRVPSTLGTTHPLARKGVGDPGRLLQPPRRFAVGFVQVITELRRK